MNKKDPKITLIYEPDPNFDEVFGQFIENFLSWVEGDKNEKSKPKNQKTSRRSCAVGSVSESPALP